MDWFYAASPSLRGIFDGTESAKGALDPLPVVPADVRADHRNDLLDAGALPVPRIKLFILQPSEKSFTGRVVRRAGLARHRMGEARLAHSH